ncbi:branched-chain amino acid ABC transporter permease [Castellaniella sp. S9]|uniref:branched-chain amino acid ABC transporter permease n=1 Tax=Castellaniella sp. S9 TaxID=2993652 RepID=UPI0022B49E46|nr:branched-chain amino acid ABC transporter permease [Castellaniella sp. S9]
MLAQLIVSGLVNGSVYAVVALGMTVLYRSTTIVNFCHGEFFMLGAFAILVAQQVLGWPYAASIVFALVLLAVFGSLIERLLMRPLRNAPHISLAMMTIALSYLFKGVSRFFYGREVAPLEPLVDGAPIEIGSVILLPQDLLVAGSSLLIVVGFFYFFQRTQAGKVIQAASQTPRGAALVGINVPRFQSLMWGAGAMLGAVAGILIAPSTLVYPDMGAHMLIQAFAAMTLGGFGSLPGAVIGALSLGVLENLIGGYVASSLVEITAYLTIIVVLVVRPQGILGEWRQGRG